MASLSITPATTPVWRYCHTRPAPSSVRVSPDVIRVPGSIAVSLNPHASGGISGTGAHPPGHQRPGQAEQTGPHPDGLVDGGLALQANRVNSHTYC
jgi:hypothetical protein